MHNFTTHAVEILGGKTNRADVLLMEIVNWLEGIEGIARLSRDWKSTQPRGYLFWIQCLVTKND